MLCFFLLAVLAAKWLASRCSKAAAAVKKKCSPEKKLSNPAVTEPVEAPVEQVTTVEAPINVAPGSECLDSTSLLPSAAPSSSPSAAAAPADDGTSNLASAEEPEDEHVATVNAPINVTPAAESLDATSPSPSATAAAPADNYVSSLASAEEPEVEQVATVEALINLTPNSGSLNATSPSAAAAPADDGTSSLASTSSDSSFTSDDESEVELVMNFVPTVTTTVVRTTAVVRPVRPTPLRPMVTYRAAAAKYFSSGLPPVLSTASNPRASLLPFTLVRLDAMDHILIPNLLNENVPLPSDAMFQAAVSLYIPIIEALLHILPAKITVESITEDIQEAYFYTEVAIFDASYLVYFAPPVVGVVYLKELLGELLPRFYRAMNLGQQNGMREEASNEREYSLLIRQEQDLAWRDGRTLDLTDINAPSCPISVLNTLDAYSDASDDELEPIFSLQQREETTGTLVAYEARIDKSTLEELKNRALGAISWGEITMFELKSRLMCFYILQPWSSSSASALFSRSMAVATERLYQGFEVVPWVASIFSSMSTPEECSAICADAVHLTGEIVKYLVANGSSSANDDDQDNLRLAWAARELMNGYTSFYDRYRSKITFNLRALEMDCWMREVLPSVGDVFEIPQFCILANGLDLDQIEEIKEKRGLFERTVIAVNGPNGADVYPVSPSPFTAPSPAPAPAPAPTPCSQPKWQEAERLFGYPDEAERMAIALREKALVCLVPMLLAFTAATANENNKESILGLLCLRVLSGEVVVDENS